MRRKSAPLSMTIIIMVFIISIMGVAKWSLTMGMEIDAQADADQAMFKPGTGLNEPEQQVLHKLSRLIGDVRKDKDSKSITENIYYECLLEHYRNYGMDLTSAAAANIDRLISDGNKLLLLENGRQITEMSFDGREVAIHIFKKIYRFSGLKLGINPDGTIDKIENSTGELYYENNFNEPEEFRLDMLIIILMVLGMLLVVCIVITKRNQLFVKGEEYINEKGIA